MFKIVGSLPVKTRLPLKAWVLAGLITLFSSAISLMHVGQPTVQAANLATAHYASVADLINLFAAL
jgi:Mg2+/citrate symporter